MNNAGNSLLSNTGNAAISAANTVNTAVSNYGSWFIVFGICLLLVLAYMLYQKQATLAQIVPGINAPMPRDWRDIEKQRQVPASGAGFGENWCFVGEDVTGRWCVKVPRPDACSPERLFSSRPGCELVPASPLPLGLVAKGGAEMKPLIAATHTK
jgi:hypothetical protein